MAKPKKLTKAEKKSEMLDKILSNEDSIQSWAEWSVGAHQMESWRGLTAVPTDTLLSDVLKVFYDGTKFPLELPMFSLFHLMAGELLKRDVQIKIPSTGGKTLSPDIWTIVLAPSGTGKSTSLGMLKDWFQYGETMPKIDTAAKFVMDLEKWKGKGLILQDEVSQLFKRVEGVGNQQNSELREALLQAGTNQPVVKSTMTYERIIEKPTISFLGLSVADPFIDVLSAESMIDGFANRFSYCIASRDMAREEDWKERGKVFWQIDDDIGSTLKMSWDECMSKVKYKTYDLSQEGSDTFEEYYTRAIGNVKHNVPSSFSERLLFRGVKYALLYHVLLNKEGNVLDKEDAEWATRVISMHLADASKLITAYDMPDIEKMLVKIETMARDIKRKENRSIKPRDVVRRVAGVGTNSKALGLMSMCEF